MTPAPSPSRIPGRFSDCSPRPLPQGFLWSGAAAGSRGWSFRRAPRRAPSLLRPGRRRWWLPGALVVAAIALTSIGLAGPRLRVSRRQDLSVEGIDIVVALDLSTSMQAADFRPKDRITVAKEVLKSFIASRQTTASGWWSSPARRTRSAR